MSEQTGTLNALSSTWEGLRDGFAEERPSPRLRLLYHVDLARIGSVCEPDIPLAAGEWQVVGRKEPLFLTSVAGTRARALEDPMISRQQLRVRWLDDAGQFEIEPCPGAKRPLQVLDAGGQLAVLDSRQRFAPGACVAIGERVLCALEVASYRSPDDDRMGMVGESEVMWQLRDDIAEVASFAGSTLILGATGTGKELVAHAVHGRGDRARQPFLIVNCAALPEQLVESLLFGHVKGAFTGADSAREGQFRAADGGTLFLDELGEMPMSVQPKLLRTLEDGHVSPVGEHRRSKVDVRLIAATNREPRAEIRAGQLREDLYHRVARHVLRIPPLAARRSDIPELFVHLLGSVRAHHASLDWLWERPKSWHRSIPMAFFATLMSRDYPGNVRELRNLAERTARRNLTPGPFRAPELAEDSSDAAGPAPTAISSSDARAPVASPPDPELLAKASLALGLAQKTVAKLLPPGQLARIHQRMIETGEAGESQDEFAARLHGQAAGRLKQILADHEQVKSKAAAVLGVSPTTLTKLIGHFGL